MSILLNLPALAVAIVALTLVVIHLRRPAILVSGDSSKFVTESHKQCDDLPASVDGRRTIANESNRRT